MEAVALHDFTPSNNLAKISCLKVLSMDVDPGWYLAELNGQSGLVPSNYVRMADHSWYVPNCTRSHAEELLLKRDARGTLIQPDGAFLVRTSETTAPDFSISVKFGNQLQHFKVLKDEAGKYYLWFTKFDSINQMIQYHRLNSISQTNSHMLLRATWPCPDRAAPAGPQTTALPSQQRVVAPDPDELRFRQNDVITVLGKEDESWWLGETEDGRRGVFPYNYVQPYS
uniref:SH3 domain-containing protein n=1 Tax=Macrostomum lignano TaxID=282301 RepID=A0A1I8F3H7_9PLAT